MTTQTLSLAGGIFAALCFVHFFVDFVFQTHKEAMTKHNHWQTRGRHCFIYTLGFLPLFLMLGMGIEKILVCSFILFGSHFWLDTYKLVFLWARFIRRPPEMSGKEQDLKVGFLEFVSTPLGKILMIVIDQIGHLTCLWPVVWVILK